MRAPFVVVVGNVGEVYSGGNFMQASAKFSAYMKLSKAASGRASGESVTMFHHGSIRREFIGRFDESDSTGQGTASESDSIGKES